MKDMVCVCGHLKTKHHMNPLFGSPQCYVKFPGAKDRWADNCVNFKQDNLKSMEYLYEEKINEK